VTINPEIKDQWVDALQSGEYQQCFGQLEDNQGRVCALGVLNRLAMKAGVETNPHFLARQVFEWVGVGKEDFPQLPRRAVVEKWKLLHPESAEQLCYFAGPDEIPLAWVNDNYQLPFSEIAVLIKEHL